eukprot:1182927-Prorocentrum_minimum.AAC.5
MSNSPRLRGAHTGICYGRYNGGNGMGRKAKDRGAERRPDSRHILASGRRMRKVHCGVEFLGSPPLAGRVELIERTCRGVVTFQFQGDEAEIILCFQISWRAHRPHEVTERSDVVIGSYANNDIRGYTAAVCIQNDTVVGCDADQTKQPFWRASCYSSDERTVSAVCSPPH